MLATAVPNGVGGAALRRVARTRSVSAGALSRTLSLRPERDESVGAGRQPRAPPCQRRSPVASSPGARLPTGFPNLGFSYCLEKGEPTITAWRTARRARGTTRLPHTAQYAAPLAMGEPQLGQNLGGAELAARPAATGTGRGARANSQTMNNTNMPNQIHSSVTTPHSTDQSATAQAVLRSGLTPIPLS